MDQLQLELKPREVGPKRANRRLRRGGQVPAVVYGAGKEPAMVAIDNHAIEMILHGATGTNKLFNIQLNGEQQQALIRDVQRHPVNNRILHIDLMRVDMDKLIDVEVSVHAVGADPEGVRAGGILEHLVRSVTVRCRPADIPAHLEADLSALRLNESFHVSQLAVPANVEILDDPETALFTILAPRLEEEKPEGEEGAAQPELVGGKKEEATEE
ncbi:MAG TPA: 50S ribosomal protein L25 [Candidatus Sumerlaeota bacterium]|nr:50S ribosomal protein L25 [Candidatus Sumerlaeota bacterium]